MYNLQLNIDRIVQMTQSKNLSINQMLKNAGLSTSIIDNMKRGRLPSVDKIYNIADYLDCSVDYLLGRTDDPNKQASSNNFSGSTIRNSPIVQSSNVSNVIVNDNNNTSKKEISKHASKLLEIFENLDIREQTKLLSIAFEIESRNTENKI